MSGAFTIKPYAGLGATVSTTPYGMVMLAGGVNVGARAQYNDLHAEAGLTAGYRSACSFDIGYNPTVAKTSVGNIGVNVGVGADAIGGKIPYIADTEHRYEIVNNGPGDATIEEYVPGEEKPILYNLKPGESKPFNYTFPDGGYLNKLQYNVHAQAGMTFTTDRARVELGAMAAYAGTAEKGIDICHTSALTVTDADGNTTPVSQTNNIHVGENVSEFVVSPYMALKYDFGHNVGLNFKASMLGANVGLNYNF